MEKDKVIPVIEISRVIQGEGKYAGIPHLLIRTTGCPLRCEFSGSKCDTPYASWSPEKGSYTYGQMKEMIEHYCNGLNSRSMIMVTGGEPTMHKDLLSHIVMIAYDNGGFVTLETAGTFPVEARLDFVSLSPKMSNSVPRDPEEAKKHNLNRDSSKTMRQIMRCASEYQLKFVITTEADAKEAYDFAVNVLGSDRSKIYFMPEGDVEGENLQNARLVAWESALKYGVNYTDRLHLIVYRDKRRNV